MGRKFRNLVTNRRIGRVRKVALYEYLNTPPPPPTTNPYTLTVKTDNSGSSLDDQFTLPLVGGLAYDFEIDWGDGIIEQYSSDISPTHTYGSIGTYTIKITGVFPRIRFNNGGDRLKALSIDNWGDIVWDSFNSAYEGCANLIMNATDAPDLSGVTSLSQAFKGCNALNTSLDHWDVSTIVNMSGMFRGCDVYNKSMNSWDVSNVTSFSQFLLGADVFNQPFDSWDVSSVETMAEMFEDTSMNQDLSSWQITSLINATEMFKGTTMSTSNYDALINSWYSQDPNTDVPFHGGNAKYSTASEFSRILLVDEYFWLIVDGGPV